MAAKVCVGCGLTVDPDTQKLIVDTAGSWPTKFGLEANAGDVYCGNDNELHVAPLVAIKTTESYDERFYTGNRALNDDPTTRATDNFTVTNPSDAYVAKWDFTVTLDFDFNIEPGTRVRVTLDGDQVFDFTNFGTDEVFGLGWNVSSRKIMSIAAGASATYNPTVQVWATGAGDAEITKLQQTIVGTIIAAPISSSTVVGP